MPYSIRLEDAARSLATTTEALEDFARRGWITFLDKDGRTYVKVHQQYRAKFILHLQNTLALTPAQISKVLEQQKPPYSLSDVKRILAHPDQ
jgi:hypothetical protein